MTDTIVALSSGSTPSGVAVIRMSGPRAFDVVAALAGSIPPARRATLKTLRIDGHILDRGLVLCFPGPQSVTGEDCAEVHLHGGRAVVAKSLDAIAAMPGLRLAEPGEFTRRGFLNGKLNLLDAEALSDLISSETEAQRRFAIENSGEAQTALYVAWRSRLLHARAMVEAELDFSDERDVPGSVDDEIWADILQLAQQLRIHSEAFGRAEIALEGYRVVLAGPPNAGKSSLLNALARRDVAIVSEEPGTTRDVIEVVLDLGGVKVMVSDTAGLRDGAAGVEAAGIARSRDRMATAHLVLAIHPYDDASMGWASMGPNVLQVSSKIDLAGGDQRIRGDCNLAVSAKTGEGLAELLAAVQSRAAAAIGDTGSVLPSRARHVACFNEAAGHLEAALVETLPLEVRAESLRLADRAVGRVIGSADAEELLEQIFSRFCIGK